MKYLREGAFDVAMGGTKEFRDNFAEIFGPRFECPACGHKFHSKAGPTVKCPKGCTAMSVQSIAEDQ